jgi:hypothetical protein
MDVLCDFLGKYAKPRHILEQAKALLIALNERPEAHNRLVHRRFVQVRNRALVLINDRRKLGGLESPMHYEYAVFL